MGNDAMGDLAATRHRNAQAPNLSFPRTLMGPEGAGFMFVGPWGANHAPEAEVNRSPHGPLLPRILLASLSRPRQALFMKRKSSPGCSGSIVPARARPLASCAEAFSEGLV